MPNSAPIMLFVLIALVLLPIRLSSLQLKGLAFFLWILAGIFLTWRGANFILGAPDHPGVALMAMFGVLALVIGWAKGQFVLAKTSRRNVERLETFQQPMRPVYVYGLRSWLLIGLMGLIGQSMTWLHVPDLWRGAVNLGIGMALIISSLVYLRSFPPVDTPSTEG